MSEKPARVLIFHSTVSPGDDDQQNPGHATKEHDQKIAADCDGDVVRFEPKDLIRFRQVLREGSLHSRFFQKAISGREPGVLPAAPQKLDHHSKTDGDGVCLDNDPAGKQAEQAGKNFALNGKEGTKDDRRET